MIVGFDPIILPPGSSSVGREVAHAGAKTEKMVTPGAWF